MFMGAGSMYYVWIIDDKLAVSPMPNISEIPDLARIFTGVAVLIEPHEAFGSIDYYLEQWALYGVNVYYAPTPDFHPVDLLELYRISKWIDEELRRGGRVLIHCMGGVGRSGLTAAAYLVYRGKEIYDAIQHVASKRPGALENLGQRRMLEDFYILVNNVDKEEFSKHLQSAGKHRFGKGIRHASKTLQFIIDLVDYLAIDDINRKNLFYATLYHCIDKEILTELFRKRELEKPIYNIVDKYKEKVFIDKEPILLTIGHSLDSTYDGRLVIMESDTYPDKTILTLYCDLDCSPNIKEALQYLSYLEKTIEKKIDLIEQPYVSYI